MAITRSVKLKLVFEDATSRNFTFNGVEASALSGVKRKVLAINADMPTNFKQTFVSASGALCREISEAKIISTEEEVIYSAG